MVRKSRLHQDLETEGAQQLLKTFRTENVMKGVDCDGTQAGSLVWAKSFGSIYWPAFIVQLPDKMGSSIRRAYPLISFRHRRLLCLKKSKARNIAQIIQNIYLSVFRHEADTAETDLRQHSDIDPNSCVMVIYLECKFRRAALPWERIIPVKESYFGEQKDLIVKLNKVESKKPSCCCSLVFKKSLEYLNEFREYEPSNRYKIAQIKFLKMEAERPKSRKRKGGDYSFVNNASLLFNSDYDGLDLLLSPTSVDSRSLQYQQLSKSKSSSAAVFAAQSSPGLGRRASLHVGPGRPKRQALNQNSENSVSFTLMAPRSASLSRSGTPSIAPERKNGGRYSLRPPVCVEVEIAHERKESGTMMPGKENKAKAESKSPSEPSGADEKIMSMSMMEVKRKGSRPKTGGSDLKTWAAEKFDNIDKSFKFEPRIPLLCSSIKCLDPIEGTPEYCHEFPFHSTCLTEIRDLAGDDGKRSYKCDDCIAKNCFLCKQADEKCVKCSKCELRYHVHCLRTYPQAEIQSEVGPITCPLHFCHTCIAEHQIMKKVRNYKACKSSSFRCIQCPTSYHRACLPASSVTSVMTSGFITCPRHEIYPTGTKRLGCFMCNQRLQNKAKLGSVDCMKCPLSYHLKCVLDEASFQHFQDNKEALDEYKSTFECEACFWGLYPLPGQTVWCQQAKFCFWPARILYPKENTVLPVQSGCFSVVYFGQQQTYFHEACYKRIVPLNIGAYDVLRKMKMYTSDAKLMTSYEEGTYVMDLSESHRSSILPTPEPIYKKIEKNVYKTVKPNGTKSQKRVGRPGRDEDGSGPESCLCDKDKTAEKICGFANGCINRDQAIECDDETCGDPSRCTNRMFTSKNSNERIEAFPTTSKGWGVRTKTALEKGDFVVEYVGEVISKEAYQWRLGRKEGNDAHYFLELDTNLCIDAEYMGNLSRLINHSCDPNCSTEKYLSGGKQVVGIFARFHIPAGTELTFDYDYETCGRSFSCSCGTSACRGQINRNHIRNNQVGESVDRGNSPSQGRKDEEWNEECEICKYEGAFLLCCEAPGCEKAYHATCLGMSTVPPGTWICPDPLHKLSMEAIDKVKKKRKRRRLINDSVAITKGGGGNAVVAVRTLEKEKDRKITTRKSTSATTTTMPRTKKIKPVPVLSKTKIRKSASSLPLW